MALINSTKYRRSRVSDSPPVSGQTQRRRLQTVTDSLSDSQSLSESAGCH